VHVARHAENPDVYLEYKSASSSAASSPDHHRRVFETMATDFQGGVVLLVGLHANKINEMSAKLTLPH
jgi:hypothetical protein